MATQKKQANKPVEKQAEKKAVPSPIVTEFKVALAVEKQAAGFYSLVEYHISDCLVIDKIIGMPTLRAGAIEEYKIRSSRIFMG